jgi:hypothetical protein
MNFSSTELVGYLASHRSYLAKSGFTLVGERYELLVPR